MNGGRISIELHLADAEMVAQLQPSEPTVMVLELLGGGLSTTLCWSIRRLLLIWIGVKFIIVVGKTVTLLSLCFGCKQWSDQILSQMICPSRNH